MDNHSTSEPQSLHLLIDILITAWENYIKYCSFSVNNSYYYELLLFSLLVRLRETLKVTSSFYKQENSDQGSEFFRDMQLIHSRLLVKNSLVKCIRFSASSFPKTFIHMPHKLQEQRYSAPTCIRNASLFPGISWILYFLIFFYT